MTSAGRASAVSHPGPPAPHSLTHSLTHSLALSSPFIFFLHHFKTSRRWCIQFFCDCFTDLLHSLSPTGSPPITRPVLIAHSQEHSLKTTQQRSSHSLTRSLISHGSDELADSRARNPFANSTEPTQGGDCSKSGPSEKCGASCSCCCLLLGFCFRFCLLLSAFLPFLHSLC